MWLLLKEHSATETTFYLEKTIRNVIISVQVANQKSIIQKSSRSTLDYPRSFHGSDVSPFIPKEIQSRAHKGLE